VEMASAEQALFGTVPPTDFKPTVAVGVAWMFAAQPAVA
jgi:hypothetical protein